MISLIALTNSAMPTAAMARDTTMAKICMAAPRCCVLAGQASWRA
jgi:hypothetical protein